MGGRGANSSGGSRAPRGYRTVGRIGGIKVIRDTKTGKGLPITSSSKSARYFGTDGKGKVIQYREYRNGKAKTDIDWSHIHDGIPRGTAHIHRWTNGKRGDGRRLTPAEKKHYGPRIKKVDKDIEL